MRPIDAAAIGAARRPVHTLWSLVFIDPASKWLGLRAANVPALTPLRLTIASFVLAIASAACFASAQPIGFAAGAVLYQLSTLADALDGLVARARPGSGSIGALVLDHSLDPWRLVLNVAALSYASHSIDGDTSIFLLSALFLAIHFTDWIEPRAISRLRLSYASDHPPRITALDEALLSIKEGFERFGVRVILFSVHERELLVLVVAPLTGLFAEMTSIAIVASLAFLVLRIRFDVALLRNTIVNRADEYLGDSENPWETGPRSRDPVTTGGGHVSPNR